MADYTTIEYIQKTIQEVLEKMDIQARIEYEDSLASGLVFNIRSRDAKILIGRQGATLYALEHIIHAMVSRHLASNKVHQADESNTESQTEPQADNRVFFSIDVDDYKRNRQYQLKQLVKDSVADMKRTGQPISLPDMPKIERKFVHMYIQEQFPHVTTTSEGEEPRRYIKMTI
jgi:predicted RNA-binding protein Jag